MNETSDYSNRTFEQIFECAPDVTAEAHARVNLIGEHTDYNDGYVLPLLMPHRTGVQLKVRNDSTVRLWSDKKRKSGVTTYQLGQETAAGTWLDYIQGVTWVLHAENHRIHGFDARFKSNVPIGSGISSSAALEVALLRALRKAFDLKLSDIDLALIGQRAENMFVGARTGIMDQMAASIGTETDALFIDAAGLRHELIPLPENFELAVIHSGISHGNRDGNYNIRREECERARFLLGVRSLRELSIVHLPILSRLPDPLSKRVRHVITENERVLQAVEALQQTDMARLGRLFYASHWSMRDDYEVSIPQIDLMVDLARAEPDVLGARLTGGGFGGAVIILTQPGASAQVARRIADSYFHRARATPTILSPLSPAMRMSQ